MQAEGLPPCPEESAGDLARKEEFGLGPPSGMDGVEEEARESNGAGHASLSRKRAGELADPGRGIWFERTAGGSTSLHSDAEPSRLRRGGGGDAGSRHLLGHLRLCALCMSLEGATTAESTFFSSSSSCGQTSELGPPGNEATPSLTLDVDFSGRRRTGCCSFDNCIFQCLPARCLLFVSELPAPGPSLSASSESPAVSTSAATASSSFAAASDESAVVKPRLCFRLPTLTAPSFCATSAIDVGWKAPG